MHLLCHPVCQLLLLFIGAASPLILHYPNSFAKRHGRQGLRGVTCCASTSDDEVGPSPLSCSREDDANKLLPRLYVHGSLSEGSLINLSQDQSFYLTNVRVPCLFVLGRRPAACQSVSSKLATKTFSNSLFIDLAMLYTIDDRSCEYSRRKERGETYVYSTGKTGSGSLGSCS